MVDEQVTDPEDVFAMDLDGDGVPEIGTASEGFVSVSKKQGDMLDYSLEVVEADDAAADDEPTVGGLLYPWTRRIVANATASDHAYSSIVGVDMDGDGDIDIVSGGLETEVLAWHENLLGNGLHWKTHEIFAVEKGIFDIEVGDVDGDDDLDVLTASYYTDTVAWYENGIGDGGGANWTYHMISDRFPTIGATGVALSDMNGDGKVDVGAGRGCDVGQLQRLLSRSVSTRFG